MSRPNRTRLKNASVQSTFISDTKKKFIDRATIAIDTSATEALNLAKGVLIADPALKSDPLGGYQGNFYGWELYNNDTAPVFLHFYDSANKAGATGEAFLKILKVPALGSWAYLSTDPVLFNFVKGLFIFASSDFAQTAEVNAQVFGTFYYWDNN